MAYQDHRNKVPYQAAEVGQKRAKRVLERCGAVNSVLNFQGLSIHMKGPGGLGSLPLAKTTICLGFVVSYQSTVAYEAL